MGISNLLAFSKTKKKVNAARFLDARGDEKQVINLERPNPKICEENPYEFAFVHAHTLHSFRKDATIDQEIHKSCYNRKKSVKIGRHFPVFSFFGEHSYYIYINCMGPMI